MTNITKIYIFLLNRQNFGIDNQEGGHTMIGASPGAEIINACRLLFPAAVIVDSGFLNTVANEELKAAFRKKALKTHFACGKLKRHIAL